ncbi:MAG TPA: alpha/beta fold hydrolase, partial [Polyangiaceae bacterium]|nr:alpha/beta fold hydrolase [Polyangiaceae bacterium]
FGLGLRPRPGPVAISALLQLAVAVPLYAASRAAAARLSPPGAPASRRAKALALGADLALAAVGLPCVLVSATLHRPQGTLEPAAVGIDWPSEPVAFRGAGGTELRGLWFANPGARGLLVLTHGIGAEKAQFLPWVEAAYRRGYHVFAYDQRNHGESSGATVTFGLVEADDAAFAWAEALRRAGPCEGPRVLWGVSLGGAALQAAAPGLEGVDGLVLDSTFADIADVARRWLPLGPASRAVVALAARPAAWLLTGRDALGAEPLRAASEPAGYRVLLLHSRADPLVPFEHAERLARAYGGRARLVAFDGQGHPSTRPSDRRGYDQALEGFLLELERRRAARPGAP